MAKALYTRSKKVESGIIIEIPEEDLTHYCDLSFVKTYTYDGESLTYVFNDGTEDTFEFDGKHASILHSALQDYHGSGLRPKDMVY